MNMCCPAENWPSQEAPRARGCIEIYRRPSRGRGERERLGKRRAAEIGPRRLFTGGDRRHAHPGPPTGNRRSAARTATAGGAGGGGPSDLLPAHGGHDFIIRAGQENRDPAPRPRRTPRPHRPSDAPTAPPASTDPGEGRGDQASPGLTRSGRPIPVRGTAVRGGAHLPKRVVFTASASS